MGSTPGIFRRLASSLGGLCLLTCVIAVGCEDDKEADHDHGHDDDHGAEAAPHDHEGADVGPATGATCPDNSSLTYTNFGKQFFSTYCLRCHSESVTGAARMMAPADHNFDKLSDIDLLSKHIDEKAGSGPSATNTSMPPSAPTPSPDERKQLSEWIACGVPE